MEFVDYLPIIWVALGVGLLLYLNIVVKLNSVLALLIVSILVGILNGLSLSDVVASVKTGFGSTLGSLAIIIGMGAVLGKLMVDSGAAQ
jgi:high-affinity gluconate transporter